MKFQPGVISLSDVSGGVLASGTVPIDRLLRSTDWQSNAGLVTVTGAATPIISAAGLTINVGDYVLANAELLVTKGGIAGPSFYYLEASGPAKFDPFDTGNKLLAEQYESNVLAGTNRIFHLTAFGRCITSGVTGVTLYGVSGGSNSTVNVGFANMRLVILRGPL